MLGLQGQVVQALQEAGMKAGLTALILFGEMPVRRDAKKEPASLGEPTVSETMGPQRGGREGWRGRREK